MTKKIAIGHIDCHVCGLESDVKVSEKNGLAYTFCGDCNVQSFCRNQHQHDKLVAKMRPVVIEKSNALEEVERLGRLKEGVLPPVTVTEKKSGFSLGGL